MTTDLQPFSEDSHPLSQTTLEPVRVMVCDFDIPFVSIAWFMGKSSLAVIPAVAILAILGFVVTALFAGSILPLFHR